MALVRPDFSEVADEIKAGVYKVMVKGAEVKEWPNGGQYINWELETFGEAEPKNNGRRVYHKTSTSGKGAFMLQRFYRAATGKSVTGEFDTEECLGKALEITIVDGVNRQTGEPTGYPEIKAVRPSA